MKNNNFSRLSFIATMLFVVFFSVSSFASSLPVFYGSGALAVPNNLINFEQNDGTSLNIYLQGDAVIHWYTTEDGYALLKNNNDIFEYATQDSYGNLVPSGVKARNTSERQSNELSVLSMTEKSLFYSNSQVNEFKANAAIGKENVSKMGGFPTTGTRKLLMILANFSNTTTTYTQTNFDNYMNQANYNGTGSFKDYYYEVSYGMLTINSTVTAWVKVPNTHDYYGPDAKWAEFIRDAVNAADAAGVDFSQFDNDGDGKVDGVAVIHQGPGQEETSNTTDIWSHNWALSYGGFNVVKDGKTVDAYTCQPEKSGTSIATIGVMCHEFGHNLGAPDYYDTDYATGGQFNGMGYWDLMDSGSYNGTPGGSKPAHHGAFTKILYGWVTPVTISSAAAISMTNSEQNKVIYKYTTTTANEYYLLENRQKLGFDASIPGAGLMIVHVHKDAMTTYENNDLNATYPQKVYPVCASATGNPGTTSASYGSINTAGCLFPYSTKTSFTDTTTPWAKSWAGALTAKPITNIVHNTTTKVVTFDFMGGGSVTPTAPAATTSAATGVSTTAATINGSVNANNATTTVTFEYGTTTSYGSTATATPSSLTGATATSVSANLTGLAASTTYNYRVKAVNSVGTTYGSNMTFTTTANPVAVTLPFTENFASTIPTGWSQVNTGTGVTDRWATSNTANAGGTAYEMKMSYLQVNPATARLVTPAINTTGVSSATLTFKHMLDAYATGVNIKVQTSTNKTTWTDVYSVAATATNINASTVTVNLTTNLNSSTTYIAFVVDGDLYQVDYYYIDNVSIVAGGGTTVVAPTVTTTAASAIAQTTATSGGNITSNGGGTITAAGVCYATTANPTTANSKVTTTTTSGAFTSSLTGLTANTVYYARAYATNSAGTAYGAQVTFTTLASTGGTTSDVTVGTGTSTQGYPLSPYYGYERSASLYTSAEIAKFGSISKLGWYPTVTTTTNVPVKIYIKTTTATTLTASTWATAISGATLVYSGTMAGTTANAWKEFTLSTAFNYTSGNLLVLVETNYGGAGTGASTGAKVRYTSKTNCHMYVRADNTAPTGTMTRNSYRPNVKITVTTAAKAPNFAMNSDVTEKTLSVYPNPASSVISLNLASEQVVNVQIYNIAGVKVSEATLNSDNNQIDVNGLANGTYILKMNDGEKSYTDKFIKF